MTIETVCNEALDVVGYKHHIGSIWEGTTAARIALGVWQQTRQEMLMAVAPDWSRKDAALALIRQAPADYYTSVVWDNSYPPLPWLYEYAYPSDCIHPLQLKPRPSIWMWRPRYIPFRTAIDALTAVKCILTNTESPVLSYTADVLDPDTWEEDFRQLIVQALARKFTSLAAHPQQEQRNADTA